MEFWHTVSRKAAYYVGYPILRFYYRHVVPPRDSSRAIVLHKNQVLLVRNIGVPYWSFPGGAFGDTETPESGLMREIEEELHLAEPRIEYRQGIYEGMHRGEKVLVHIYIVTTNSYYHKKQWEIDEAAWFPLVSLPPNLSVATKARLQEYAMGKQQVRGTW